MYGKRIFPKRCAKCFNNLIPDAKSGLCVAGNCPLPQHCTSPKVPYPACLKEDSPLLKKEGTVRCGVCENGFEPMLLGTCRKPVCLSVANCQTPRAGVGCGIQTDGTRAKDCAVCKPGFSRHVSDKAILCRPIIQTAKIGRSSHNQGAAGHSHVVKGNKGPAKKTLLGVVPPGRIAKKGALAKRERRRAAPSVVAAAAPIPGANGNATAASAPDRGKGGVSSTVAFLWRSPIGALLFGIVSLAVLCGIIGLVDAWQAFARREEEEGVEVDSGSDVSGDEGMKIASKEANNRVVGGGQPPQQPIIIPRRRDQRLLHDAGGRPISTRP